MISFSDDPDRFDMAMVVRELQACYWAADRSVADIEGSFRKSLSYGLFEAGRHVAVARVITDQHTFAYLCDVVVVPDARGRGLGRQLMAHVIEQSELRKVKWLLRTKDAHALYSAFGFIPVLHPERYMEKRPV